MNQPDQPKPRRRGRPPKEPPWLKEVAREVGRGVPLRKALWGLGMYTFTERELKSIYRLVRFRRYVEEARIEFFREWGRPPRRGRTKRIERILAALQGNPDLGIGIWGSDAEMVG